jgi:hypothetical protein
VNLLAESEPLNLVLLRDEVHVRVLRTFGRAIHYDLWKDIEHSAKENIGTTVVDNMYRFRTKQCSDPLDVVYSIASMSIDGPQLQVDYIISNLQLARNVLRLLGDEMCRWRVKKVFETLPVLEEDQSTFSEPFINIGARLLEDVSKKWTCPNCTEELDLSEHRASDCKERTYLHCLVCRHEGEPRGFDHLIVTEHHTLNYPYTQEQQQWLVILHSHQRDTASVVLEDCLVVTTFRETTQLVVVRLSLRAIRTILSKYSPLTIDPGLDAQLLLPHKPNYGWRLVD